MAKTVVIDVCPECHREGLCGVQHRRGCSRPTTRVVEYVPREQLDALVEAVEFLLPPASSNREWYYQVHRPDGWRRTRAALNSCREATAGVAPKEDGS